MKINETHILPLAAALVATVFPAGLQAADYALTAADGARFLQLDFPDKSPPLSDSAVGMFETNLLLLRASSGIPSGYVNVVLDGNWVVRNMIVPLEQDYPYSHLSTRFDLGVSAGTDVTSIDAQVVFSDMPAEEAPSSLVDIFPVGAREISTGGVAGNGAGGGGSATPPDIDDVLFGDPSKNTSIFQLDHPNIETAVNQCYPMSVANSLQFLANTTDLVLPHSHVPGLRGDDSLVGQIGLAMDRTATSRLDGEGVMSGAGIDGKLKYLANNGLQGSVETRHWGTFTGSADRSQSADGVTVVSTGEGLDIPFDEIVASLQRGEDCEALYYWPDPDGGAHAVDIVAAGTTNGQPWIIENSDLNQKSDNDGAGPKGFVFSHLTDPDKDGEYDLNGTDMELYTMICQRFIPESTPPATVLLPTDGYFTIPGADVSITDIMDQAGHSPFVDSPPSGVDLIFENGQLTLTGSASWLPITAAVDGSSFNGSNVAIVAGYSGINNSISGEVNSSRLDATITLGTEGGLPGGESISWKVTVSPETAWPWLPPAATSTGIKPRVRVNGFRNISRVDAGEPLSINLSLDADGETASADWFLALQTGAGNFLSFALDGTWSAGLTPAFQGTLRDMPNTAIYRHMGGLPPGEFRLYFGIDMDPNGQLDSASVVYDTVTLVIE